MSRFLLISAIFIFAYFSINTALNNHRTELRKKYPGLGIEFDYFHDEHGQLKLIDLKGNNETEAALQSFYKNEQQIDNTANIFQLFGFNFLQEDIQEQPIKHIVTEKFDFDRNDIFFTLYNWDYKEGINMTNYNFSEYDTTKLTKVVTHGFLSSGMSDTCISIKNNYLETSDINVIILDWSAISGNILYPIPAIETGSVADYCSKFLSYMFDYVGLRAKYTHLIGHSLGAHVMGFTGKRLINQGYSSISRITGLDPAGPLFSSVHINEKNGNFVDIIHTDAGWFGIDESTGHIDFYPNGGESPQPGCDTNNLLAVESCSHGMSWKLYARTILDNDLYMSSCNTNETVPMGSATPTTARGKCNVTT